MSAQIFMLFADCALLTLADYCCCFAGYALTSCSFLRATQISNPAFHVRVGPATPFYVVENAAELCPVSLHNGPASNRPSRNSTDKQFSK